MFFIFWGNKSLWYQDNILFCLLCTCLFISTKNNFSTLNTLIKINNLQITTVLLSDDENFIKYKSINLFFQKKNYIVSYQDDFVFCLLCGVLNCYNKKELFNLNNLVEVNKSDFMVKTLTNFQIFCFPHGIMTQYSTKISFFLLYLCILVHCFKKQLLNP